jgi:hypothetical protein
MYQNSNLIILGYYLINLSYLLISMIIKLFEFITNFIFIEFYLYFSLRSMMKYKKFG